MSKAYQALSAMISTGEIQPGARLRESALADAIGVSRTPIREALRRLAAEGVVEVLPNRGAQLVSYSQEDLNSLFDLRVLLEPYAVGLAVPRLHAADLDRLADLADQMSEVGALSGVTDKLSALNNDFHAVFMQCSGNRLLAGTLTSVIRPSVVSRTFHQYSPDALRRSLSHHHELVDAARAGDAEWAQAVMTAHIRAARQALVR